MKKVVLLVLCSFLLTPFYTVSAEDWDDFAQVDRLWDGQQTITNQQFEEVMNALEQNENKKEEKQQQKKIKKIGGGGTSLHTDMNPENEITELQSIKPSEEGFLVNLPVNLLLDNKILEKGYYKLFAEREKDGNIYISFYQSQYFKGKTIAVETEDDYGEKEINFAKMLPYNENFVKIIYGSLDFNAYAMIPYVNIP